jgi:hypothetical protein
MAAKHDSKYVYVDVEKDVCVDVMRRERRIVTYPLISGYITRPRHRRFERISHPAPFANRSDCAKQSCSIRKYDRPS